MSDEHDRKDDPLPGSVSNQNGEEAEPGHGGGEETRDTGGRGSRERPRGDDVDPGGAGEGSQSTGHPDNAG